MEHNCLDLVQLNDEFFKTFEIYLRLDEFTSFQFFLSCFQKQVVFAPSMIKSLPLRRKFGFILSAHYHNLFTTELADKENTYVRPLRAMYSYEAFKSLHQTCRNFGMRLTMIDAHPSYWYVFQYCYFFDLMFFSYLPTPPHIITNIVDSSQVPLKRGKFNVSEQLSIRLGGSSKVYPMDSKFNGDEKWPPMSPVFGTTMFITRAFASHAPVFWSFFSEMIRKCPTKPYGKCQATDEPWLFDMPGDKVPLPYLTGADYLADDSVLLSNCICHRCSPLKGEFPYQMFKHISLWEGWKEGSFEERFEHYFEFSAFDDEDDEEEEELNKDTKEYLTYLDDEPIADVGKDQKRDDDDYGWGELDAIDDAVKERELGEKEFLDMLNEVQNKSSWADQGPDEDYPSDAEEDLPVVQNTDIQISSPYFDERPVKHPVNIKELSIFIFFDQFFAIFAKGEIYKKFSNIGIPPMPEGAEEVSHKMPKTYLKFIDMLGVFGYLELDPEGNETKVEMRRVFELSAAPYGAMLAFLLSGCAQVYDYTVFTRERAPEPPDIQGAERKVFGRFSSTEDFSDHLVCAKHKREYDLLLFDLPVHFNAGDRPEEDKEESFEYFPLSNDFEIIGLIDLYNSSLVLLKDKGSLLFKMPDVIREDLNPLVLLISRFSHCEFYRSPYSGYLSKEWYVHLTGFMPHFKPVFRSKILNKINIFVSFLYKKLAMNYYNLITTKFWDFSYRQTKCRSVFASEPDELLYIRRNHLLALKSIFDNP